ncbi:magnesium chelatase family protein [Marvinbryantia formatexigens]|nr:YifB family Mg chelatase-like AAA ATPase [Marvinbryantia formatexigens]SDG94870.1 magnesium chelatase family protein [Marvinbryantia formatexigens]
MFSTVMSASVLGVESRPVNVEADITDGLPSFTMVGFLSTQVREAQERVRTALKNSGLRMEPKKITVNLSPADVKKSGTGFDLAIAVAVAAAYGKIAGERLRGFLLAGELNLNGRVLPVPGILPIAAGAAQCGCHTCIVPKENEKEGAVISGVKIIGVSTLAEAIAYLKGERALQPACAGNMEEGVPAQYEDFAEISGQAAARRAAEVAAAGFHNLLMTGPPGAGKSMLAKRIPGILPPLSLKEKIEISKIYSIAGMLTGDRYLVQERPFRAPHHSITAKAMVGGGGHPRPGEVSLAHNGVLFLDELPEFSRETLEVLRQPLEERRVCISRTAGSYEYPANIMLVAAMNPCPCGYYPDMEKCTCTHAQIQRYLNRISSPLLDRIDITIEVPAVQYRALGAAKTGETTEQIRERVLQARRIQEQRYRDTPFRFNADLDQSGIRAYCALGRSEGKIMEEAFEKLDLSARTYYRILKVARTIADMEGSGNIRSRHLQEALCYRSIHRRYWINR